jgi:Acyl-CoA dehydrogenase, C-terminal domain
MLELLAWRLGQGESPVAEICMMKNQATQTMAFCASEAVQIFGGAGGNAINNMIAAGLQGVDFIVANTDAQALSMSMAKDVIQMGTQVTGGLALARSPKWGAPQRKKQSR